LSEVNRLGRSLIVYAFSRFAVLFGGAGKAEIVLKVEGPDAIQNLQLTLFNGAFSIVYSGKSF
jgi:hypothetical protein